jgi:hypothetical protein
MNENIMQDIYSFGNPASLGNAAMIKSLQTLAPPTPFPL